MWNQKTISEAQKSKLELVTFKVNEKKNIYWNKNLNKKKTSKDGENFQN